MRLLGALAALAALLSAQQGSPVMHPAVHQAAQELLSQIHQFDLNLIALGRKAARDGSTPQLRRLGSLIARDHALAEKKVRQLVGWNSVTLQPVPAGPQAPLAAEIANELDFLRQGHVTAVARLRDFLRDQLPIVSQEHQLAQRVVPNEAGQ